MEMNCEESHGLSSQWTSQIGATSTVLLGLHTINSTTEKQSHLMYLRKSQTYLYRLDRFILSLQVVLKNKTQSSSAAADCLPAHAFYPSSDWWPPKRKNRASEDGTMLQ